MNALFSPQQLGELQLQNRVVMAPMTRSRASEDELPNQLHVEYYSQRATAGLVISEGTHPSRDGKGYCRTPGLYRPDQVRAWRRVTDAVHAAGGLIALQIMHCGRIGNALNKAPDAETVAPSAVAARGEIYTAQGMRPFAEPRALRLEEIGAVVEEYRRAAALAREAGFDGVELHCTSGYLPAQFLSTGTNRRRDRYGGSLAGRCRFVLEALEAMCDAIGGGRVGMRICPGNPFNDLWDENPAQTFSHLLREINRFSLAWLHVIRMPTADLDNIALAREHFSGPLILNESYTAAEAETALDAKQGAAVSFARAYIANPDLVRRMQEDLPLAELDPKTLYTPGAAGYTDYPCYGEEAAQSI